MSKGNFDTLDNAPTIPSEPGGQILSGRYRIIRQIGSGGMGTVYLARDVELDIDVAVKVLPMLLANNKRAIDNLRKEAKTALKLSHHNIVRLHTFQSDEAIKYLVMEYVDGGSLEEKISESGTLSVDQMLKIFTQVAAGLDYAHSQNVLHRDIKPANIMLTKDGTAKLADFGIAREMHDSYTRVTGKETSGTLLYMAPEQFRGGEPDHRSDIYSLAASIYESLSGKPPFWRGSIEYQIINESPKPLNTLNDRQNTALLKALSKEPDNRQNRAGELLADFGSGSAPSDRQSTKPGIKERYKDTLDYSKTINIKVEKQKARKKKVKIITATGVLVLLIIGVFFGIWMHQENQPEKEWWKNDTIVWEPQLWQQAVNFAANGDYSAAVRIADELLKKYPDWHEAGEVSAKRIVWQKTLEDEQIKQRKSLSPETEKLKQESFIREQNTKAEEYSAEKRATVPPLAVAPFDATQAKEYQKAAADYYDVPVEITNSIGMKLVLIPPGEFMMGSPSSESQAELEKLSNEIKSEAAKMRTLKEGSSDYMVTAKRLFEKQANYQAQQEYYKQQERDNDEVPQHKVKISKGFYFSIYEVTQAKYQTVMGTNPSCFKGDNLPVEMISWDEAVEFCRKLSEKEGKTYRLPTEAEWEYACRAGTSTPFYFGETISTDQVNYNGDYIYGNGSKGKYRQKTVEVGSLSPNGFGLCDVHGNIWEWCSDWYDGSYYSISPKVDPQGPTSGGHRVLRGGAWISFPKACRSANRDWITPSARTSSFGFRVVMEIE
jgi:formylglycine-generating enzyme required for sulfatase activity/serine/threonine protein kinase